MIKSSIHSVEPRRIRTHSNIRTRLSILTSTGPGHQTWQRLQETEKLQGTERKVLSRVRRDWR